MIASSRARKPCPKHGQRLRRLPPDEGADRYKCFCAFCGRFYGFAMVDAVKQKAGIGSAESTAPPDQQEMFAK